MRHTRETRDYSVARMDDFFRVCILFDRSRVW